MKIIQPQLCLMCGEVLPTREGRGRPRLYCSGKCRGRSYQSRNYSINVSDIIERWGDNCYLCGDIVNVDEPFGPKMPNVDHVIPLSRGGPSELSNLRVVHYACNLRKGAGFVCPHCIQPI